MVINAWCKKTVIFSLFSTFCCQANQCSTIIIFIPFFLRVTSLVSLAGFYTKDEITVGSLVNIVHMLHVSSN